MQRYEYLVVSPGSKAYQQYLALRHEVFCEELGRVPAGGRSSCGSPVESDEFDAHSVHVLCRCIATGVAVGCSRLILPGPKGLNVSARYALLDLPEAKAARVGEIGRMAVASRLRRYRSRVSAAWPDGDREAGASQSGADIVKGDGSKVALGLYREIFRVARVYELSHCYAAMEPALGRLLNRMGFPFREAGPLNAGVHPPRQAYLIQVKAAGVVLARRGAFLPELVTGGNRTLPQMQDGTWSSFGGWASFSAEVKPSPP